LRSDWQLLRSLTWWHKFITEKIKPNCIKLWALLIAICDLTDCTFEKKKKLIIFFVFCYITQRNATMPVTGPSKTKIYAQLTHKWKATVSHGICTILPR